MMSLNMVPMTCIGVIDLKGTYHHIRSISMEGLKILASKL